MKKNNVVIGGLVALVFLAGGWWYSQSGMNSSGMDVRPGATATVAAEASVRVGDAPAEAVSVTEDLTALAATRKVAEVEVDGEGDLAFVVAIDGVAADTNKREFWKLVVNGNDSQVGAGLHVVQPGDKIAWKLDTY